MTMRLASCDPSRRVVALSGDRVLLLGERLPRVIDLPAVAGGQPILCSSPVAPVDMVDASSGWPVSGDLRWLPADEALSTVCPAEVRHLVLALQLGRPATAARHCTHCGAPGPRLDPDRLHHECCRCGHVVHPRLDPAVMVLVVRGGQILLVRGAGQARHGAVTGFVDPGESAEDACRREVYEETGVVVEDIRYVASLSWPGPHSLMLGFLASGRPGEVVPDGNEVETAAFHTPDQLPELVAPPNLIHTLLGRLREQDALEGAS